MNSANLEDGEERFNRIAQLAKRYGAALVCLTIDERGMAKSKEEKVEIAKRMYHLATKRHSLRDEDILFDVLTLTVGSGDARVQRRWSSNSRGNIESLKVFFQSVVLLLDLVIYLLVLVKMLEFF